MRKDRVRKKKINEEQDEGQEHGKEKETVVDIIWAKADRGIWGLAHVFDIMLLLTRDLVDSSVIPEGFRFGNRPPKPRAKPMPKAKAAPAAGPVDASSSFAPAHRQHQGFLYLCQASMTITSNQIVPTTFFPCDRLKIRGRNA